METAMKCRGYQLLFVTLMLFFSGQALHAQLNYTYSFISTGSTFVANTGATTLISSSKDESTATGNIGFTFTYNCNTYTQYMVSSNGWMTLGTGMTGAIPLNQLTNTSQGPILAPLWDDMKTSSTGKVDYVLSGGAGSHVLTIEWLNMLWDNGASGPVMSYQVKLYEATGVIEFWYRRDASTINNGSGGASIGITSGANGIDFWAMDATTPTPIATYGREPAGAITARPTGNRIYRFTPDPTSFVSATTTQANTGSVTKCNPTDQVILGVEVETTGSCNMYSLTQMQLNMTGSTAPATDVSKVHVYYTGLSSGFAPINEFVAGGTTPAAGNFNVSGSQLLQGGTNYFWVAYDVAPGATVGNVLDGQCLSVTLSGGPGVKVPTVTNPAGSRAIANCSVAPGGVGGMSFWAKGNAGTSSTVNATAISSWGDQSGNGRNATQGTAANQPSYRDNGTSNMNFNPVVNFDAASQSSANGDYMDITGNGMLSPGNNPYTVYSVIKPSTGNASTPGKYIFTGIAGQNDFNAFDIRSGGSYNDSWNLNDLIVGSLWTSGYPSLATFNYNTAQREMFVAGGSVGTKVGYDRISPDANNALGCQRSNSPLIEFYDGAIGEIITYANYSHTAAQRNQVETYLGLKYGITLQHDYLSSTGTKVWDRALNTGYNNNIVGIARDDNSALSQKESKSTSTTQDMLTLYMGAAKTTNQASNTGTFAAGDKSFFIVGNNGNPYIYPTGMTNDKPAGICCRLDRIWMAQKTNFTNADLKLEFDFNVVTPGYTTLNTADLRLLVDNDGVFANATVLGSPAITITVSASVVTVTVNASNFAANSYFTLGSVSTTTMLPVNITGFAGLCKDNTVQLGWTKQSGPDNNFSVERSSDGVHFTAVGALQSNSAASQSYTWSDAAPLPGTNYYRLKMEGLDAVTSYSDVVLVNPCSRNNLQLATDGVTGESTLLMQLPQNAMVDISLNDMLGRQYDINGVTGHRAMQQGYYRLPVTDRTLARGVYVLSVAVNGNKTVYRLIQP